MAIMYWLNNNFNPRSPHGERPADYGNDRQSY